jgi:hypothetical protein
LATNDVFYDLTKHIGVFWEDTFNDVPDVPGIYAWYYPLRIVSLELDPLLRELTTVFNFDSMVGGPVKWQSDVTLCWRTVQLSATEAPRHHGLPAALIDRWKSLAGDETALASFRQQLLAASILLPPLYIGKAEKLQTRCFQHIRGSNDNGFHSRFERFAKDHRLTSPRVEKLIFACVRVQHPAAPQTEETAEGSAARLLESILQVAGCPPYGMRP